jgi:hypothetical protein
MPETPEARPLTISTMATTHDAETGKRTGVQVMQFHMIPPDTSGGQCAECAVVHDPDEPHNKDSLAYQYAFYAKRARWPTWKDALAHCSPEMQAAWKAELVAAGAWSEPPAGTED